MKIRYEANIESCEDCLLYLKPEEGSMIRSCAYDGVEDTNEPIIIGCAICYNWLSMPYSIRPCPLEVKPIKMRWEAGDDILLKNKEEK